MIGEPLQAEGQVDALRLKATETGEACPDCARPLEIKLSKSGLKFFGCTGYAEKDPAKRCKYTRDLSPGAALPTGLICEICGSPMMRASGRFGPYLRCARYPGDCTFTMKFNKQGHPVRKFRAIDTDRVCSRARRGDGVCGAPLVIRVSARGKRGPRAFLSCSAFPKCRHAEDLPEDLGGLGAQALARWQANAVKNERDWAQYLAATGSAAGGGDESGAAAGDAAPEGMPAEEAEEAGGES